MSTVIDNSTVWTVTALATNKSAILDLKEIDILSVGVTVSAASGSNTLALYESVDGVNFVAISGLTVTITGTGTTIWHLPQVFSRYAKVLYMAGSGSATFVVSINARNNTIFSGGNTVGITLGTN